MLRQKKGIFYGWWVLLATSVLIFYGVGSFHYGFSVFVDPIVKELGWSMTLVSGAFSLYRLEAGLGAPFVGFFMDRTSPRKLVTVAVVAMGAGFILLSRASSIVPFYLAFIVIAVSFAFVAGSAMGATLIGKWFVKRRGLALGLYGSVTGIGGFMVPILSWLITIYGWRFTFVILGLGIWIVGIPAAMVLRQKPEEMGLLPDGESAPAAKDTAKPGKTSSPEEVNLSVRNALHSSAFWLITLSFMSHQLVMSALFVHLVPNLTTIGFDPQSAALVITSVTVTSILGRVGFGWLADKFSTKWLLVSIFVLQSFGTFALTRVQQMTDLIPFVVFYSLGYGGAFSLRPAIVAQYYGRKNLGTIYGVIHGASTCGGVAGPMIAGILFDLQHSYYMAFMVLTGITIFTALFLLFLKRPTPREQLVPGQQRI